MSRTTAIPGWRAHYNSDGSGDIEFVEVGSNYKCGIPIPSSLVFRVVADLARSARISELEGQSDAQILGLGGADA